MSNRDRRSTQARLINGIHGLAHYDQHEKLVSQFLKLSGDGPLSAMIQSTAINIVRLTAISDKFNHPRA